MEPEFLTSVNARMALETPQIVLEWAFDDVETPLTEGVEWPWERLELRRSAYRYPNDSSDGDGVLSEAKSTSPSTSVADTSIDAMKQYYYSLFLQYKEHSASLIGIDHNVKRLGPQFTGAIPEEPEKIYGGVDGSTTGSTTFTSSSSTFLTDEIEAGFVLEIAEGGADDGFYRISSVDSETQLTLDTSTTLTASDINFFVYSNKKKYWISGIDFHRKPALWRWDSEAEVVDFKIKLDTLFNAGERVTSLSFAGNRTTSASDGATTTTTVRTLTSAGSTFISDGVKVGDMLIIDDSGTPGDNGHYVIAEIDSETQLKVSEDWPAGNLSALSFTIYYNNISFTTTSRYIRIPYLEEPESTDVIEEWNLSSSGLTPGYQVTGSFLDMSIFEASDTVFVLDTINQEIVKLAESDGSLAAIINLSGLDEVADGTLVGLAADTEDDEILVGNRNYIYSLDENVGSTPTVGDVEKVTYSRQLITADIGWYKDRLTSDLMISIVDDGIDKLQTYEKELGRGFLWQQPFVADKNTVALYHLDDSSGDPVDSGPNSNDAANSGMSYGSEGRFSTGLEATAATHYLDLTDGGGNTFASDWDGAEGAALVWFKASDEDDLTSGTHVLFDVRVDANNLVRISIESGTLTFNYTAGGTAKTVAATHPSPDDEFHCYKITWSATNDEVKAYVDGDQFGTTQTSLGTWAGTPASARVGDTTASAVGVYDEVRVSDIPRIVHDIELVYTEANKMHAFSGRDYEANYEDGDRLGFHYRDEVFTEKFVGGNDFIIRNDYDQQQLSPQNKVMSDSEIIFRGPTPLPTLGDLGRLSRLVGLWLDRLADNRESLLTDLYNDRRIGVEDVQVMADFRGLPGLDIENWNVDKQRRFLRVMPYVLRRGGLTRAYESYARLLGFLIQSDPLLARRRWDTVVYSAVDTTVQAVYLDQMGSMDTYHETFPLALLRYRLYIRSSRSEVGSTSGSNTFTDATASFRDTAEVGGLLQINDIGSSGDNGKYEISEVHSDTEIEVNGTWPIGSLTGLTYTVNWQVPRFDPWAEFLLERFRDIAPDSMRVMHRDEEV